MKTRILLLIFLGYSFFLPFQNYAQHSSKATEIIILHTNDMHAKIDNFGKLAYLSDSLRKTHKYVYLFAAGDNFTGNPVVDMVEDKGFPMIDLMNRCGFTVTAIGNHEFDLGQEKLAARMKQASFPFISCNIDASATKLPEIKPYIILKAGKIKLPVLAIIQLGDNGLPDSHPSRLEGIKFTNGLEKAQEFKWLKSKYGSLIGLTHLGVEMDEPLANAMPEFDLIVGGHSHTTMTKPMLINGVTIVQTGSGLKNVGKITLWVEKGKIVDKSYELIALSEITSVDAEVQKLIDHYNANEELNKPVGIAEAAFTSPSQLGSLMTDAVTSRLKVDFAFQNVGGIRISSLPEGEIKLKDVYKLDPFGNLVVIYKMNSEEIKSLIMNAYNRGKEIDLEVSGMKYTVIIDEQGICTEVVMIDNSGQALLDGKEYTVGVNSYISATYKFNHRDSGTTSYSTTAQALIEYLGEVKKVNYTDVVRTATQMGK
ncbi:MAG: bifunctional metallophosphatase/5'-nucleotidase [Bacteroidales bacterium]|nr:bifunctional metallophosphatase/5'-nucleotidase [Bacteroidales bacterium]